jgi:2-keto-4-pentenoate hydratase/2-oxohepta-3-ene-1,7-dioic acid hydratase in catechol pathway
MTLNKGDMILTGTPKIAPVEHGDKLHAMMSYNGKTLAEINVNVIRKSIESGKL